MRNRVLDGASIGVVANQMRTGNLLPIEKDEFLRRYGENFAIKWEIVTNATSDLLLCLDGKALWSVRVRDGLVRKVGTYAPDETDFVDLFKNVDFSKPLSISNSPSLDKEGFLYLKRESDGIWSHFAQTN